ncbi:MAG: FHA domain-containing protein [Actinomycetota bacterium]
MPQLVLDLLRFVFLAVLYIFVWRAVKAVYLELRPESRRARPQRAGRQQAATPSRPPARRTRKAPGHLAVVDGNPLKGKTFDLGDELVIGRAQKCHLVLDDTYASQMHARIFSKNANYMLEDLGSTNGTYLNRRRITSPTELQRGDQVKIGKTVMEIRR